MRYLIGLGALLGLGVGCISVKPYEKEYLLHPTMDEAVNTRLEPQLIGNVIGEFERLSTTARGSATSSCPTCGG